MTDEEIAGALLQHALGLFESHPMSDTDAERLDSGNGLIEAVRRYDGNGETHYQLTNGRSRRYVFSTFLVTVAADGSMTWKARGGEAIGTVELSGAQAVAEFEQYKAFWDR